MILNFSQNFIKVEGLIIYFDQKLIRNEFLAQLVNGEVLGQPYYVDLYISV